MKSKLLVFSWFLLAPTPAAVTTGVPHAVRTLNFLPTFQIFIAIGIMSLYMYIEKIQLRNNFLLLKKIFYGVVICLFLFNFSYYLDQYFVQTNYYTAEDWQYGYEPVVKYIKPIQRNYQSIIVSDQGDFSQSYIFFLFYLKYDPALYQRFGGTQTPGGPQRFANFQFRQFNFNGETNHDSLYIGAPSDFPPKVIPLYTVSYPNGQTAMEVVAKQ